MSTAGQVWQWSKETVDSFGESMSMAADSDGNIHISYMGSDGFVKYGFRPSRSRRWFTMVVPGASAEGETHLPTRIAVDPRGNPHICFTPGVLKYASFDGKQWTTQQIDPGSGLIDYTCSVGFASDGTPYIVWYQYGRPNGGYYLHVKFAVLKNDVWLARTVDFEGQTGKWNSIAVDPGGMAYVVYDSFLKGNLKCAYWNGKELEVNAVDSSGSGGMGNSVILNREGKAQIAFEHDDQLLYAWPTSTSWRVETVDQISTSGSWLGYRSRQALDPNGNPHVVYEDGGAVKHAFWDGGHWRIQVVSPRGIEAWRYEDVAIDKEGVIYIAYRDSGGPLTVAVGHLGSGQEATDHAKPEK